MRGIRALPFAAWVAIYLAALAIVCRFVFSAPWLSAFGAAAIIYAALLLYWAWERRRARPRQPEAAASPPLESSANGGKHRAGDVRAADHQVR